MGKKDKNILLLIGLPGSGKTTWKKEFLAKNDGWMSIGRDDFRFMIADSPFLDWKGETLVSELMLSAGRKIVQSGYNLIIDNTHCRLSYINDAIEKLGDIANIDYRYFDVPLDTCIERDLKREKKVGEEVIRKMHKDLKATLDSFNWQPHKKLERIKPDYYKNFDDSLPYAIISDVDGTLCHMNGKRGPFDWKKVGVDTPDRSMIETLKAWAFYGSASAGASGTFYKNHPNVKILICSGRDASCRNETEAYFKKHSIPYDALFMRPANDYRKDSLIKKEIFENEIDGKYNVIMVYDDRDQVVNLWRSLGLKCAQVETGEF